MRKVFILFLLGIILGASKMNEDTTFHIVNYAKYQYLNGDVKGDDYYIGKVIITNNDIKFISVKTDEDVGVNSFRKMVQDFSSSKPRLNINEERRAIDKKISEFLSKGIRFQNNEGQYITTKLGDDNFVLALQNYLSESRGIVSSSIGEKYFQNGWSRSRKNELEDNREYYNFEYPFQKMTSEEYLQHYIQKFGIIK